MGILKWGIETIGMKNMQFSQNEDLLWVGHLRTDVSTFLHITYSLFFFSTTLLSIKTMKHREKNHSEIGMIPMG